MPDEQRQPRPHGPARPRRRTLAEIERDVAAARRRQAAKEAVTRCRRGKRREMALDPDHELHGTTTGYSYGCRCERCKAEWERRRGSVRRQALSKGKKRGGGNTPWRGKSRKERP